MAGRLSQSEKLGSWFLLLIISYTMVALINKPKDIHDVRQDH